MAELVLNVIHDLFQPEPLPRWARKIKGVGTLEPTADGVRLVVEGAHDEAYSSSQLDDFHGLARDNLPWCPPATLTVRARFSHRPEEMVGTAGFGWWNAPFDGDQATEIGIGPQVMWFFFASPPADMATTLGWSGNGWFAQCLNVPALPGWAIKLGMFALRVPGLEKLARRTGGAASQAAEAPLREIDITQWHEYRIEWRREEAVFWIDGAEVLRCAAPPGGPLALVLWVDNQWATVDGAGGLLTIPHRQWMELAELHVTGHAPAGDE